VGLEDNLFMGVKEHPATNLSLVERIVALGRAFEREPATAVEARATIGLGAAPLSPVPRQESRPAEERTAPGMRAR
jgi:hypothetical protein